MACRFTTKATKNINDTFNSALKEIPNYKVAFDGTSNGGKFSLNLFGGQITGSFTVVGNLVEWDFVEKPFILPCKVIQTFIQNYI
jgi:hypothetical protein